ncbi:MAG: DNA polymerase III subunit [Nitrospinota bacterium]|nr:DNA polymerase III subunit [Nitrospinota bacterium]
MADTILKLSQIAGQATAVRILKAALPPGSPGNGYLFAGPAGVGKMTTALAWARALFCTDLQNQDACGRCGPCLKTQHENNPDLLILAPMVRDKKVKEEIDIATVRGLISRLGFKPYEASRKVAIIKDADRLNLDAANALLKTLEEPSADTVLILTASNPARLPATIISRCRALRFNPAPVEVMVDYLTSNKGVDKAQARTLAVLSRGAIGSADPERLKTDMELRSLALEFIGGARSAPVAECYVRARVMDKAKERDTVDKFLVMVLALLREMAVMKFTGKRDKLVNIDIIEEIEKAGRHYSGRRILDAASMVEGLMASRSLNINPFLVVSLLFSELRKDL